MNVENVLDEMIDDLNAINDDFINNYFDEEFEKSIEQEKLEQNEAEIDVEPTETKENNEEQAEELENTDSQMESNLLDETKENNSLDGTKEDLEETNKKTKSFSYNEILDRLDKKENIDINNPSDILNLIGNSNNSDEFFGKLEKVSKNDK